MTRDIKLIALWRKVAASSTLSGKRRLEAIDRCASADGVYFTSLEDARQHQATVTPSRAKLLVERLLRKLANDERASVKARDSAVSRLAFIGGHAVSGLYKISDAVPPEEKPDLNNIEGIRAEIARLKAKYGERKKEETHVE